MPIHKGTTTRYLRVYKTCEFRKRASPSTSQGPDRRRRPETYKARNDEIRSRHARGESSCALARVYHLSSSRIQQIVDYPRPHDGQA